MSDVVADIETQIEQYNNVLAKEQHVLDAPHYTRLLLTEFYRCEIDVHKVDELASMAKIKGMHVKAPKLERYGVVAEGSDSAQIGRLVKTHNFIEGTDYKVERVPSGTKPINEYTFTSKAFMRMLTRTRNTDQYAKMYVFIFYCVFEHYADYQTKAALRAKDLVMLPLDRSSLILTRCIMNAMVLLLLSKQ